ncbi:hypothetical protein BX600DRAFT_438863 [Xylariales sp. PMI_506]|nr:hypothetical protein BX600DRAFT_438863 [Xylariales sp. PMI_506]
MTRVTGRWGFFQTPPEIRQMIYNEVVSSDIHYELITRYKNAHSIDQGFSTTMVKSKDASPMNLPWINLLLTCRLIYEELSAYIASPGAERTYVLNLVRAAHVLGPAIWQRVPCPPSHVRVLHVNIDFRNERVQFWGDGGPRPIVRQLYQTLNCLLHYGPVFTRREPLPQPLKLERLVIHLVAGKADPEGYTHQARIEHICRFAQQLKRTGLLCGYIDHLVVSDTTQGTSQHVTVEPVQHAAVPAHWHGYGFEWGVEGGNRVTLSFESSSDSDK